MLHFKRIPLLLAAAALLALFVVAAPALSTRPYVPAPVEFEMAAPGSASGSGDSALRKAGTGPLVSPVLRAPKRFNLVGLRWTGTAEPEVALRVRDADGRWSPWRSVGAHADHGPDAGTGEARRAAQGFTDAAWAGDADHVQYRLSRPVPGLRLHFVNTLGTATAAERLKTAVRRAARGGVVTAARLIGTAPARAQAAQPAIVPRSGWGAKNCVPRSGPDYGSVKAAFVHHTVTLNDYTPEESPSIVLGICRYHRNSNGWNDVGYNFLVDKYGTVFEGRAGGIDRAVVGAQAQGFNAQSTGIANLGDFSSVPQSADGLAAMAGLIRWKLPLHGAPTEGSVRLTSAGGASNRWPAGTSVSMKRISGHRDGNNTACPGDALYAQLPQLREMVASGSAAPPAPGPPPAGAKSSTRVSLSATPSTVTVPTASQVGGVLRTAGGDAVVGATVSVQALRGGRWQPVAAPVTDASGAFSAPYAPTSRRVLRARFLGGPALRRSTSRSTAVAVRPAITIKPSGTSVRPGVRVRLRGGVRPHKPRVTVYVERRSGARWVRVARMPAGAGRGRYGVTVRPRRTGRYRVYTRFAGDSANAAGRSARVEFRVARTTGGDGGTTAPRRRRR